MRLSTLLLLVCLLASEVAYGHRDPEIAGFVPVAGGEIWYRLNGREHLGKRPAIIAIAGGPGSSHRGNMPLVELANEWPVVLYDQLDTGHSTRTNDHNLWTVGRFVSELDALRKALNLTEVVVIGGSWGGTLAAEYSVSRPVGLVATILGSPLISTRQWIADAMALVDGLPEETKQTVRKHLETGNLGAPEFRAAERVFNAKHVCRPPLCPNGVYGVDGPSFNADLYRYMWGPTEFHASGTLRGYDISPRLGEIEVPVLMICGEFDEARPETCQAFARSIKRAQTFIVPNASHSALLEQKEAYLGEVRRFLRAASQGRR